MQSNKASKKTRTLADETAKVLAPETTAKIEVTAKPRTSRSSKSKKVESEVGSAKHHHKNASQPISETQEAIGTPLTMTTAAGAGPVTSAISDGVGFVAAAAASSTAAPVVLETTPTKVVGNFEIASLAYSYWVERGYSSGSAEEDWFRAERELRSRS